MITKQTKLSITIIDCDGDSIAIDPGPSPWVCRFINEANEDGTGITYDEAKAIRKVLKNLMRSSRGEE